MGEADIRGSFESLGNAVVVQAVKDYRDAAKILSRGRTNHTAEATKRECERFFQSEYFSLFTNLDGNILLCELEKEDWK